MSPVTNRRADGYGGSVAARGGFWMETLEAVRSAIGADCAVATRICVHGADGLPGIDIDETLELVKMADDLVDPWDLTVGSWPEDSGTSRFYSEGTPPPRPHPVPQAPPNPIAPSPQHPT